MTESSQLYHIIGLMSGTSMDGVDAALVQTDGQNRLILGAGHYLAYPLDFKQRLKSILGGKGDVAGVEAELTDFHIRAIQELLAKDGKKPGDIDYIGFHGHTILHNPKRKGWSGGSRQNKEAKTWQIGDAKKLSRETGIAVVHDFRTNDVAAGGQGAPLVPIFHQALAKDLPKPLAVLNIGGVANVTYIGANDELIAFDTGPGNALIDDWIKQHTGQAFDQGGDIARRGKIDIAMLAEFLSDSYFIQPPPKSLDRDHFKNIPFPLGGGRGRDKQPSPHLAKDGSPSFAPPPSFFAKASKDKKGEKNRIADGAATLTAFTAQSIASGAALLPTQPAQWIVCGGGRKNKFLMESLRAVLPGVTNADELGWNGDLIEAQAFAYLAARSVKGLPISFPGTTGVREPLSGGSLIVIPNPAG